MMAGPFDVGNRPGDRRFGQTSAENPFAGAGAPPQGFGQSSGQDSPFGQAPFGQAPVGQGFTPPPPAQPTFDQGTGLPPFGQPTFGQGSPPPMPTKTRGRGGRVAAIVAGALALVVIGTGVGVAIKRSEGAAQPPPAPVTPATTPASEPSPTASEVPTPEPTAAGPSEPGGTSEPGGGSDPALRRDPLDPIPTVEPPPGHETLTANPLYDLPVTDEPCGTPLEPFGSDVDAETQRLMPYFDCATSVHRAVIAQVGSPDEPPHHFGVYTDPASGACGDVRPEWTGIYCSADRSVRLDLADARQNQDPSQPLTYGYGYHVLFHEYGHHLQDRVGILSPAYNGTWEDPNAALRRLELQAECFAGIGMARSGYADDAWRTYLHQSFTNPETAPEDSVTHGTAQNRAWWIHRGWNAQTYGDCNTWIATPELVT